MLVLTIVWVSCKLGVSVVYFLFCFFTRMKGFQFSSGSIAMTIGTISKMEMQHIYVFLCVGNMTYIMIIIKKRLSY